MGERKALYLCIAFAVVEIISGCTLSFQNIDTHGQATDLVDDTQTNQPRVIPTLTIPVKP